LETRILFLGAFNLVLIELTNISDRYLFVYAM